MATTKLIVPKTCPLCGSNLSSSIDERYYHCDKILDNSKFYTSFTNKFDSTKISDGRGDGYYHYWINREINPLNRSTEIFIFKPYHIFAYHQLDKFSIQSFKNQMAPISIDFQSGLITNVSNMPRTEEDLQNWMMLK